ncbi:MAG: fluoride efflux transporter CrcB [Alphaproteobacteria bacterium]|nr:fluoride efflux transporter CrcB [Alphaproteobacteria bacterium]
MIGLGWVALGGALGAVMRYLLISLVIRLHPAPFPLGTMLVNILGSLAMGLLLARLMAAESETMRLFLVTGLLGGFTTFSAFSWDVLQLVQRGQMGQAALYVGGSVLLSLIAVAAGFQVGR